MGAKRGPKKKILSKGKLKNKAWDLLSKIVRLESTDKNGYVKCVTCGKVAFWEKDGMQAGHFIASRCNSILFEELGIHPQCIKCNIYLHGNQVEYYIYMKNTYGEGAIDMLRKKKHAVKKFTREELLDMIDDYTNQVKKLKEEKGL